ncbi:MAG: hypothetical protein ABW194_09905, partial [Novosphingobium sp.]
PRNPSQEFWPRPPMRRFFLLALALLTAGTAHAQTVQTAYAGGSPVVLTIPVTASVGGRCGFATAPSGTYNQANFDQTGLAAQFDFALNCTGPSRVAILSSNGGLLTAAAADAGYANKADYSVTLNLVANDGSTAQGTCAASTLVSGSSCSFVGTASTTQGLRLAASAVNQSGSYVRISAPRQTGSTVLVAGTYSDALTVTVSPAL